MKKTLAKTLRSALSLVLALVMVLGTVSTALAAPAVDENKIEAALGKLAEVLQNYGPDVAEKAYDYAVSHDYVKAVKEYAVDLRNAVVDFASEYEVLKADVEAALDKAEAKLKELKGDEKVQAKVDELKARIKDMKGTLAAIDEKLEELKEAVKAAESLSAFALDVLKKDAVTDSIDAVVEKYIQAREALFDALAKVEKPYTKLDDLVLDLVDLAKEVCECTKELAEFVADDLRTQKDELKAIAEKIENALAPYMPKIKAKLAALKAAAIKAYKDATTADYVITYGSNYVAIGDDTAAAENSYVDLLNDELGLLVDADKSMTAYTMIQDVVLDEEKIAGADLITLGFSAANFVSTATDASLGDSNVDWSAYLPEKAIDGIELALNEMQKYIEALGLSGDTADSFCAAAEAITYNALVYAYELPKTIAEIRDINPDAVLVVVGLDNPMEETSVTLGELTVPMDLLTDAIVEATNLYTLAYAILAGNCTFVAAPNADNDAHGKNLNMDNIATILLREMDTFLPNAEGQKYIQERIYNALNVSYGYLWGDADLNGVVDYLDAMSVLQCYVEVPVAGTFYKPVCDVDADNDIDYIDAMQILQKYVGVLELFPVEK